MTGILPVIPFEKDHAHTGKPGFNLRAIGAKHCHRILHITRQSSGADRMPSPLWTERPDFALGALRLAY
jgi:hypothetical protein